MSEVTVQVEREELVGLAGDLRSHANTDPDESNLRRLMTWTAEQLERITGDGEAE